MLFNFKENQHSKILSHKLLRNYFRIIYMQHFLIITQIYEREVNSHSWPFSGSDLVYSCFNIVGE